jgi:hypothetical protein
MTSGKVYLASSRESFPEMVARIMASLGSTPPRVAASYAAVADSPEMLAFMSSFVTESFPPGAVERFALPGEDGAMSERDARAVIARANIVDLSGGDPVLGAKILTESGADVWLREARARGAMCLGVSAGSIILCAHWAAWPDTPPKGAPFDGGALVRCAGVVDDLVVDCHAEEDEWNELHLIGQMLRAAGKNPRLRGLATGSGVIVDEGGSLEMVGSAAFEITG